MVRIGEKTQRGIMKSLSINKRLSSIESKLKGFIHVPVIGIILIRALQSHSFSQTKVPISLTNLTGQILV